MKNYLLIWLLVFGAFFSKAQETDTIFIQLYGIGGGYGETSNGNSLSYSIGESVVTTTSNFNQTLTQGFQQNSFKAIVGIVEVIDNKFIVNTFPNPTTDFLNIKVSSQNPQIEMGDFQLEMLDLIGNKIAVEQNFTDIQTLKLDLRYLSSGVYIINLRTVKSNKIFSTFKVTNTAVN